MDLILDGLQYSEPNRRCPITISNQLENGKYNLILVWFNKMLKKFICLFIHALTSRGINPFMPTGAFNICCPRDCVSRHNGGASGVPLKPLRDDSALSSFAPSLCSFLIVHILKAFKFQFEALLLYNNYEWAKRTKFLLAVIYGSACRH